MAYENNNNKTSTTGVLGTVLGGTALAGLTGLLNGNQGGLFGNSNPEASATYQLAKKDAEIAEMKAERYADQQMNVLQLEIGNLKQRMAAMEAAAPLRDKIVGDSILALQANLSNISGYMVKSSALPEAA